MDNRRNGYSLIEVLVSLSLLSILMLGLNTIQSISLRSARSADDVSKAEMQLYSMAERLKLLNDDQIDEQILQWNKQNQILLPNGHGTIKRQLSGYQLTLFWGQEKSQLCDQLVQGLSGCLTLNVPQSQE